MKKLLTSILISIGLLLSGYSYAYAGVQAVPQNNAPQEQKDKYQTDLFTGSASYSYPISVPKGTNDLTPEVKFIYNSLGTNDLSSQLGNGWQLNHNYIERDTKNTPANTADDIFKLHLNGSSHDLVYVPAEDRYYTKVDTFVQVKKLTGGQNSSGEYWVATTKDGTAYRFGNTTDSELVCDGRSFIDKWNLNEVVDTFNNHIYYTYLEDSGVGYISEIEYNNDKQRVVDFIYETNPVLRTVYPNGCKSTETSRLKSVQVKAQTNLVHQYDLTYEKSGGEQYQLVGIQEKGKDGSAFPTTGFGYHPVVKNWNTTHEDWINNEPVDVYLQQKEVRIVDVTGDALPDIVKTIQMPNGRNTWRIWRNLGTSWSTSHEDWWNNVDIDVYLQQPEVEIIDVTGEGYADIVKTIQMPNGRNTWRVWRGTGSNWITTHEDWINNAEADVYLQQSGVKMLDVTGDGLTDIVKTIQMPNGRNTWRVWRNTGNSWNTTHEDWINNEPVDVYLQQPEVVLIDVNGDGLTDIVKTIQMEGGRNTWRVWLNNGSSWNLTHEDWINNADIDVYLQQQEVRLVDVSGDNLPDIVKTVQMPNARNTWKVLLNKGNSWSTQWDNWIDNSDADVYLQQPEVRMHDVNGDGLVDLVKTIQMPNGRNTWRVWKNKGYAPQQLAVIQTSIGGTIMFDYTTSTKFDNTGLDSNSDLPFPLWLVDRMRTLNGVGGSHYIDETTTYSYLNGAYDAQDREYRGFNYVLETNSLGTKKNYWFNQDDARKGKVSQTETRDAQNNLFTKAEYTWSDTQVNGVYKTLLNREKKITYDGVPDNPKVTQSDYLYDNFGNIIKTSEAGDLSTTGDEKYSYNEYVYNPGSWIVSTVKHQYLLASDDTTKVKESWFYYDGHPGLDDLPTKGSVTKQVEWLEGGVNPETTFEYNTFGNKTKETNPNGGITQFVFGTVDLTNTYPDKQINAKNQQENYTYDLGTGSVLSKTDANNLTTTYEYDAFGRITKEIKPYDTAAFPTVSYQYFNDGAAPEGTLVSKREVSNLASTLDEYSFIDGFGRVVQKRVDAQDLTKQIVVNIFYNSIGQVDKVSVPHLDNVSTTFVTPLTDIRFTSNTYDPVGRLISLKNPDDTTKSSSYDHWVITKTDENNHQTKDYLNAYDKVTKVEEINGSETYATTYSYNPKEELIKIVDALDNTTDFTFDSLGRKVTQHDSDLGTWVYEYDPAGNQIKQTDNRGVITLRTYDSLNRVTKVDYPTDTDVLYTYDTGKVGTLSQVTDASGTVNYAYDNRLRKIQEQRVTDGITWTTAFTFDSADRVVAWTNPDGEIVRFAYNPQGEVSELQGIVNNINYNALGKITKKEFANGLTTDLTYSATNFRLNKIKTGALQDLDVTYDNVGNVASINNVVSGKAQSFGYDSLDRLVTAQETGGYDLAYQYNNIGNLTKLTKNGTAIDYTYGQNAGIHALTSSTEVVSPSSTPTPSPSTGFVGQYFNNKTLSGTPALTRNDTAINFDWGGGGPGSPIGVDNFSVRWTKNENFETADYKFSVTADDGVRVYIDNQLVIDKWIDQGSTTYTHTQPVTLGVHTVKIEYYENGGGAVAKFNLEKLIPQTPSPTPNTANYTFYKGVNLNGNAVTIDGNAWQSMNTALGNGLSIPSGNLTATSSLTPNPVVDSDTSIMLNSAIWKNGAPLSINQTLTNGDYQVYIWVMENWNSYNRKFNLVLEGNQVASEIGYLVKNDWVKYGPYNVTIGDGTLNMSLVNIVDSPHIMGMAIYQKNGSATPTPTPSFTPAPDTYVGQYFNNKTLSGSPALTRSDSTINFDWGGGGPGSPIGVDNFSARWTKTQNFTAGDYQFLATGDDGIRLFLDGVNVLDKWFDQGATSYMVTKNISAGNHTIVYEYYENGGGAVAKLSYTLLSAPSPTATPTAPPTPTPTAAPTATPASGTELLTSPWHLVGNNGASEKYQGIAANALNGKTTLRITYDLHGLNAIGGDASAIIFDQNGWKFISLSNYGQNGYNGQQTVDIPLSAFSGLNPNAAVGTLHTRFWYGSAFTVDITSIKVF